MIEHIIKRILYVCLFLALPLSVSFAQSPAIKQMRSKATAISKEIEEQKKILLSTQNDVNSQLRNLSLLEARIKKQKSLVSLLKKEARELDKEIKQIGSDIKVQEKRVESSRNEYAEALRRARKYSKTNSKLSFLLTSDNFNTLLRRYRYTNEYMDAHDRLAKSLEGQIAILSAKKAELEETHKAKAESLKEQEAVSAEMQKLEKEQRATVARLKKQSGKVQAAIKKKQKDLNSLNKRIDAEIERILAEERVARKRAEEAARKKREAAKNTPGDKKGESKKEELFASDAGVAEMTGSFLKNKKKMPVPITGPYLVVDEFGTKNVIEGKGNVKINNKGIVLEGSSGAKVRCIFEGRVTAVVNDGNYHFVLVRHGEYISVYSNVVNMRVSGGETVKAGDILGDVGIDAKSGAPKMQFQLRKEKQILNPAHWLKM
ncbi:MAG: peptidoglycan DD-metalloendopeptidase family protein [Bacteroidaceae bacterium]|nr:peptidoglycan DD-metalloendopeptidase family protein [Bacteroidaceae bacterium]